MTRTLLALALLTSPALAEPYMPICAYPRPAPSCIADADTLRIEGERYRLEAIDAPERFRPTCEAEREAAERATQRLHDLLQDGFAIDEADAKDRYGRYLVRLILPDGRDAGQVLVSEGLARDWPDGAKEWCE